MPARIPMTPAQRAALLALPDTEEAVLRFHHLSLDDLAIATARAPETRLGYALQLCCLRYPGRHLRRGEVLPAAMLDHLAEQVGVEADVIAGFAGARRPATISSRPSRHVSASATSPIPCASGLSPGSRKRRTA